MGLKGGTSSIGRKRREAGEMREIGISERGTKRSTLGQQQDWKRPLRLELLDISRAHVNARPKEPTYMEPPPERQIGAAQTWEEDYGGNMKD